MQHAGAVSRADVTDGIGALELRDKPVCVHVSMRSFGWIEHGAVTVVDGLLEAGCTVLVATFSHQFAVAPPADDRPARNGLDYSQPQGSPGLGRVFAPDAAVEPWLGAAASAIRTDPQITHCGRECIECRDAIAGGPIDRSPDEMHTS